MKVISNYFSTKITYCKAVPTRDIKYKTALFEAVLSRTNSLISGYIVNNHGFLCFRSSLPAVGYLNVAVNYVISAAQDGGQDNENKRRTLGPQIIPIQHSLISPTVLHILDLSCQNVTPTTVKCRSTIHD